MNYFLKILKIFLVTVLSIFLFLLLIYGHSDIPKSILKSKYAQSPSKFIPIDGMNVHFRDEGKNHDALPIILIHGTGSSLHTFNDWTNKLKNTRRVIRMDLPAYGLTGPFPDRNYSIDNYVHFIYRFLSELNIQKCVLAGNSLGGNIAWNYTLNYPRMVDKLILINASGYPSNAESTPIAFKLGQIPLIKNMFTYVTPRFIAKASIENVYADKLKVSKVLVDRYFELTLSEGNRQAFVDKLESKNEQINHDKISLIHQKTLILWGDQDRLIPIKNAYRFQNDLPNDTLVILNDVGHVPMEESPESSLKVVMAFLRDK